MLLWSGQTVSLFGSSVTVLALPSLAILVLGAKPYQLGLLGGAEFAAFPILGLFAGVWADRLRRRPIMVVADLGRALALASIPLAYLWHALSFAQLYIVALFTGVLTVFFDVSYQAYLPSLVERSELVGANARLEFTRSAAQVAGNGLAGLLIQTVGAPLAILVDAASFLVSVVSLLFIRTRETFARSAGGAREFFAQLGEGVGVVAGNPVLRAIAGCTATSNLGSAMSATMFLIFAYRNLHLSPVVVGAVLAFANVGIVGAVAGPAAARRLGLGRTLGLSAAAGGVGLLLLPLASYFAPVAVLLASQLLFSLVTPIYNINQVSLRQAIVPDALQGRMNATMRTIVWGTLPLGSLLGDALGSLIGVIPTLVAGGIVASFAALWILAGPVWHLKASPALAESTAQP